jgi:hypothetical protein
MWRLHTPAWSTLASRRTMSLLFNGEVIITVQLLPFLLGRWLGGRLLNENILQRVEPLLCNDREMGGYTRAVSGQRLSKHVHAATNRRATTVVLLETGCLLRGPCRGVVRTTGATESILPGVYDERNWAGGRGIATVGAVTRKRLVTDWEQLDCVL